MSPSLPRRRWFSGCCPAVYVVMLIAAVALSAGRAAATEPLLDPATRPAIAPSVQQDLGTSTAIPSLSRLAATAEAGANPIVAENALGGDPSSEWDVDGAGDDSIQGFTTDISVNRGQTVFFKIDTNATAYRLDIYRMGYYDGLGARQVATVYPSASLPQNQPNCQNVSATGLTDCGNWVVSASWAVPGEATSGIYFAKAVRTDTGGASHIVFVVRDDTGNSDILFQTADTTWQAYNEYGGNSLYTYPNSSARRAYQVSYNRPFFTRLSHTAHDWVFSAEYPMVRWLEANGYNVSYFTGVDADRYGSLIPNHKVFLSVGHDEYWSGEQRDNVEAARDAGVHLAFFSGNEVFWKTRWEASGGTNYRTLVCYKETHANDKIDQDEPLIWTGTWRDPRFSPPADGGYPENALTGTIFTVNEGATTAIKVPQVEGRMRFWRNTSVATLGAGKTATLTARTLGYEWDEDLDNGFRPAGLVRLSKTTVTNAPVVQDYGSTYGSGTAVHRLTLYKHNKHSSGALVFGAGTVQWSWGLDGYHDGGNSTPDVRMRQATVNLFADMGVEAGTLQPNLVQTAASTDTDAPTSVITSPPPGAKLTPGAVATVTGTASDTGGGVVGGVEVSVDGGATWHPATGLASWSYKWTPRTNGTLNLRSRAVDDSANLETPGAGITVTVGTPPPPLPPGTVSLWNGAAIPTTITEPDYAAVELGVKFQSSVSGQIVGLMFYKGSTNTGTHVGTLWSNAGAVLRQATFTNEAASGWQQVLFASPVPIFANTTYVASYHTNVGRYSVDEGYFASAGTVNGPLTALQSGASGGNGGNGVYAYSANATFPSSTYNASNYWVDVLFKAP